MERRFFVVIFFIAFLLFMLTDAYGWMRPKRSTTIKKKTTVKKNITAKKKNMVQDAVKQNKQKRYKYVNTHDLNNDGKVNNRDRLIWLRNKDGAYDPVYVSGDNEDIVEVMDLDSDGNVEQWEMQQFYYSYDLNGNGVLEDGEIEKASE